MVGEMIKKGGGLAVLLLLVAACGDVGGSGQCGGAEGTGSCVRIETIEPDYEDQATSNVDTVRDICNAFEVANDSTVEPTLEAFTDHNANVTISNRPLAPLKKEDISDVTLVNYAVTYTLNLCPEGANCPPINTFTVAPGETIGVKADESFTVTLPMMSIAAKEAYDKAGGSHSAYPSYTATYTMTGTDSFQNPVSVTGSTEFTIGNYDNCTT